MRILVDYRPALRARTGVGEYIHQLVRAYTATHHDECRGLHELVEGPARAHARRRAAAPGSSTAECRCGAQLSLASASSGRRSRRWPGRVDVVHAAHPLLIPSRHAAQVVTIHDLFFLDHPERVRDEIRRDYPALAPAHARRADAVITSSRATQRLIVERLGVPADRIYCCPPGAPAWKTLGRAPNVPPDGYVLFLGTLEPRKNVGVLLDAFDAARAAASRAATRAGRTARRPMPAEWLARIVAASAEGVTSSTSAMSPTSAAKRCSPARARSSCRRSTKASA